MPCTSIWKLFYLHVHHTALNAATCFLCIHTFTHECLHTRVRTSAFHHAAVHTVLIIFLGKLLYSFDLLVQDMTPKACVDKHILRPSFWYRVSLGLVKPQCTHMHRLSYPCKNRLTCPQRFLERRIATYDARLTHKAPKKAGDTLGAKFHTVCRCACCGYAYLYRATSSLQCSASTTAATPRLYR